MKRSLFILLLFMIKVGHAQSKPASNEDFINSIFKLVADSNTAHYYLFADAHACSFKKYDYDEWYKYALNEDVPVYILEELAKKSFTDAAPLLWQQEKLLHAECVDEQRAKAILVSPGKRRGQNHQSSYTGNRLVYYFSRPAFTDDYQYAVIDIGFRCDDRQCGMGATYLFKQVNGKWIIAGRKSLWSS